MAPEGGNRPWIHDGFCFADTETMIRLRGPAFGRFGDAEIVYLSVL